MQIRARAHDKREQGASGKNFGGRGLKLGNPPPLATTTSVLSDVLFLRFIIVMGVPYIWSFPVSSFSFTSFSVDLSSSQWHYMHQCTCRSSSVALAFCCWVRGCSLNYQLQQPHSTFGSMMRTSCTWILECVKKVELAEVHQKAHPTIFRSLA